MSRSETDHARANGSVTGFSAVRQDAAVYVVDLAGFTKLTESWVEQHERLGAERASDLVTSAFQRLSQRAEELHLDIGGFGGDSLSLWTPLTRDAPPLAHFDAAINSAISVVPNAPSFRSIRCDGEVWAGEAFNGRERVPVIWGEALATCFRDMKKRQIQAADRPVSSAPTPVRGLRKIESARIVDRWSMVVMLMNDAEAMRATQDQLGAIWAVCGEITASHRSLCENLSQDEKGLFVTIGLDETTSRTDLKSDLAGALTTLGLKPRIREARGAVFSEPLEFGRKRFRVYLGAPLNRAAKALADPMPVHEPQEPSEILPPTRQEVFGRDREIGHLSTALNGPLPRGAQLIEIAAPAGMGKSTLLDTAIEASELARGRALRLNLRARHAFAPYATLIALGSAAGASGVEGKDWAQFAQDLAAHLPEFVIIDDWHWCDPASAKLFPALFEAAHGVRFVLLYRKEDNPPDTGVTAHLSLPLEGLEETATQQILTARIGRTPSHEEVETVMRLCQGNPFWIREVAGEIAASQTRQLSAELSRRTSLDGLLHHRAEQLSRAAHALWRVLASWQAPIEPALAQSLLSVFAVAIDEDHYRELADLGWGRFVDTNRRFALTHQILAEAGRSAIPATVEQPLNQHIARALTQQRADKARIAQHWDLAGQPGRAAVAFRHAGESAVALGAHSLGLALLDRSERIVPDAIENNRVGCKRRRRRQLAHRASAHWGNGEVRKSLRALAELDRIKPVHKTVPSQKAQLSAQRAEFVRTEAAHFAGRMFEVMKGVRRGGAYRGDPAASMEARARRSGMLLMMMSYVRIPVGRNMSALTARVQDCGDTRAETLLRVYHGIIQLRRCSWTSSERSIELAYNAAGKTHDPLLHGVVIALDASLHLLRGDGPRCIEAYRRLGRLAEQQPNRMYKSWSEYGQAQGHLIAGEPDIALQLARQARTTRRGVGDHLSACIIEGVLGRATGDLGDYDRAVWHARRALRWGQKLPPSNFTSLEGIAAPAQLAARAAIAQGQNSDELRELQRKGRRMLRTYAAIFPFAQPRLDYVDGLIAEARGDTASACRRFGHAVASAESVEMAHEAQLARSALCRIGDTGR